MNIIITGTSRGVGFETANYLARKTGNTVFAVSRDANGLELLRRKHIDEKNEGRLIICVGDIGSDEYVMELKRIILSEVNSVQIIINNAGLLINKTFEELGIEDWKSIYEANVISPVRLIKNLLSLLKASREKMSPRFNAHIVNIGSIGGIQGTQKFRGLSAYSTSKGAMGVMTECLAEEFSDDQIAVNCLALGSVETEMFAKAFPGYQASQKPEVIGKYIGDFAVDGPNFYNGKTLPISFSTP